jgi:hypothetical protein
MTNSKNINNLSVFLNPSGDITRTFPPFELGLCGIPFGINTKSQILAGYVLLSHCIKYSPETIISIPFVNIFPLV